MPRRRICSRWVLTTFFGGRDAENGGDPGVFQPHRRRGLCARLSRGALVRSASGQLPTRGWRGGASSYPPPLADAGSLAVSHRLDGLGPIQALYQARFMRYLEHRGIGNTEGRKVWAFVGDGEMTSRSRWRHCRWPPRGPGQPGVRRQLQPAAPGRAGARQRLDIQELEGLYAGRRRNVIKLFVGIGTGTRCIARDHEARWSAAARDREDGSSRNTRPRRALQTANIFHT